MSFNRRGESGNVFFTLFGAVALVGVIGVATTTLMKGPVGTVVTLNQKAKVESQLQIARKLAALDAAQRRDPMDPTIDRADCDGDGTIEATAPDTASAGCATLLTGGGCLPTSVGASRIDPWGTLVGYCGWDHDTNGGGDTSGTSCVDNTPLLQGANGIATGTVLAVISAGPNRSFETSCVNAPTYISKPNGSDDIVFEWTYEEAATGLGGGLWSLVSGDGDKITTDKDVEFGTDANFSSGTQATFSANSAAAFNTGSTLDLSGGGLFNLPDHTQSGACTGGNISMLRVNTQANGQTLQICDPLPGNEGPAGDGWTDIGGSGASSSVAGGNGDIQFNSGNALWAESAFRWDVTNDRLLIGSPATANDTVEIEGTVGISSDLNVHGIIEVDAGTASNPGFTFTSANSTGLYLDSGIGMAVGGSERLLVNSGGAEVTGDLLTSGDASVGDMLFVSNSARISNNVDVGGVLYNSNGDLTVGDVMRVTSSAIFDTNGRFAGNLNANGFFVDGTITGSTITDGNDGMVADGSGGIRLQTNGTSHLHIDSAGDIGIGLAGAPTAQLDIDGILRLRNMGAVEAGDACTTDGAIVYGSGDRLLICSSMTGFYETIGATGGGGGGTVGLWHRAAGAIQPITGHAVDDFAFGNTTPGTAGSYMFFDKSAAGFRVGTVGGAAWGTMGNSSVAMGNDVNATGASAFALGQEAVAGGNYSGALGLGNATGTAPQVSAVGSLGIFMGDQSGVNLNVGNVMLLAGGRLVIDPDASSATAITPTNGLAIDVEGSVGAMNFCNELGTECFTAGDIASGATGAPGANREILYNSNGDMAADARLIFSSTGGLGINATAASTRFDVGGTIRIAYEGEACDATREGGIHYNSATDQFLVCKTAGQPWEVVAAGTTVGAAGNNRELQFNSGGQLGAMTGMVVSATGLVGFGTATPAAPLHITTGGANARSILIEGDETQSSDVNLLTAGNGVSTIGTATTRGWTMTGRGNNFGTAAARDDLLFYFWNGTAYQQRLWMSHDTGNLVIGDTWFDAGTKLAVEGTIRMSYNGEACDVTREGGIHYNSSTDTFYVCRTAGSGWQALAAGAASAGGSDRTMQFNSGGYLAGDPNFVLTSAGRLGIGTASPTTALHLRNSAPNIFLDLTGAGNTNIGFGLTGTAYSGIAWASATNDLLVAIDTTNTGTGDFGITVGPTVKFAMDNAGKVSIGNNYLPNTQLDVDGTMRMAYDGEACDASREGGIQYNSSTDTFYVCRTAGMGWQALAAGAASAGGGDREVQFNSNGLLSADSQFRFTSSGSLILGNLTVDPAAQIIGDFRRLDQTTVATQMQALRGHIVAEPTGNQLSGHYTIGVEGVVDVPSTSSFNMQQLTSVKGVVTHDGGGNTSQVNAFRGISEYTGTGTVASMRGASVYVGSESGTVTDMLGYYADMYTNSTTMTNMVGVRVDMNRNSGAVTNRYGVFLNTPIGTVTNDWGFYQAGSQANRLGGYLGVGTPASPTLPATQLDVAGTIKMGYDAEACDATREGGIHYNSSDDTFYVCRTSGMGWQALAAGTASAAGSDRQLQFNSGGTFGASANLRYLSNGELEQYFYNSDVSASPREGISSFVDLAPTSAQGVGKISNGIQGGISVVAGNTQQIRAARGITGYVENQGTGAVESLVGSVGYMNNTGASTGISSATGAYGGAFTSAGTITNLYGVLADQSVSGGTVTNVFGLAVNQAASGGTITNRYGIIINAPTGTATNDWGIYQAGAQANRLGGYLGVGTPASPTLPVVQLDVAGTIRMGYDAEACDATREGSIHYNSSNDTFYACRTAGSWTAIATGSVSAAGSDRNIQFNSGGSFAGDNLLSFSSTGQLTIGGGLLLSGDLPLSINANTNDYAPANLASNTVLRITTDASRDLTGIAGGTDGRVLTILNVGANPLVLRNDVTSTAGNRFLLGADLTLAANQSITVIYDATSARWRALSSVAAGGTGGSIRFTSLTDAPSSYTGQGMRVVRVNNAATALEFTNNVIETVGGIPAPAAFNLDDIANVAATSPTDGHCLKYTSSTTTWEPGACVSGPTGPWTINGNDIYYNSSGSPRVGIGNAAPTQALDVTGTVRASVGLQLGLTAGAAPPVYMYLDDIYNVNAPSPTAGHVLTYSGGNWISAAPSGAGGGFWTAGAADNIYYNSGSPRVGIGNVAPTEALDVTGTVRASAGVQLGLTGGAAAPTYLALDDISNVNAASPTAGHVLTYSGGNWISAAPSGGSGGGFWTAGAGDDIYYNSGTPNVGIGNTNPVEALDVTGNIRLSGGLQLGLTSGIASPATLSLDALSDVVTPSPSNGQVLLYSGGNWIPGTASGGGGTPGGSTRQLQFNSGGAFAGDTNLVYTATGRVGIGNAAPTEVLHVTGFVRTSQGLKLDPVAGAAAPGGLSLDDLTNVVAPSASNGQVLLYSGGNWIPGTASGGGGSVTFTSLTDVPSSYSGQGGRFVKVNTGATGLEFSTQIVTSVAGQPAPTGLALSGLTDVSVSSPTNGQVLMYSGSNWIAGTASGGGTPGGSTRQIQFNSGGSFGGDTNLVYTSTGRVGVGNAAPTEVVDVTGTVRASEGVLLGSVTGAAAPSVMTLDDLSNVTAPSASNGQVLLYSGGNWIPGTASGGSGSPAGSDRQIQFNNAGAFGGVAGFQFTSTSLLDFTSSNTGTATGSHPQFRASVDVSPSAGQSAGRDTIGVLGRTNIPAGNSQQVRRIIGTYGHAENYGTGAIESMIGQLYYAYTFGGANVASIMGAYGGAMVAGTSNVTTLSGLGTGAQVSGGTVATAIGLMIANTQTGGTVGTRYDMYIEAPTGSASTEYGIYQAGAGVNYFGGNVGIGNNWADVALDVTGSIEYTGTITDVSDMRLKTDIHPLRDRGSMLDRIAMIDTYSFRMKNDLEVLEFGVMAQELEKVFPELVHTAKDEMGTKSVNYIGMMAPVIEATKELKAENDNLRSEIAALRAERDEMKTALNDLATDVKGLKAHTGYGIDRAEMGLWMLLIALGSGSLVLLLGGIVRNRQQKAE